MCAAQSELAYFLPADTVVDSGRVLRRPIDEWTAEITVRLRKDCAEARDLPAIGRLCGVLNNAALVFVYGGQSGFAESLCQLQLEWLGSFRGLFPAAELAALALNPWVNLGRLCRRSKDFQRALRYFGSIHAGNTGAAVRFDRWECRTSDAFRQIAEPLCVYEILRTHLQTGDLDQALEFAGGLDEFLPMGASMLKMELLLHVHLRRAQPHSLPPLLKAMPWPRDQFGVFAQHYYSSVVLSALQQRHLAARALENLTGHWIAYLERPERDSRDLRLAIELCRFAKHLECGDLLPAFLAAAASAVIGAREVLYASQLLDLVNLGEQTNSLALPAQLRDFIASFGYKTPSGGSSALAGLRAAISQTFQMGEKALCA